MNTGPNYISIASPSHHLNKLAGGAQLCGPRRRGGTQRCRRLPHGVRREPGRLLPRHGPGLPKPGLPKPGLDSI